MTDSVRYSSTLIRSLDKTNIKPILVLEIDSIPFLIGSDTIKKILRYGDEGLLYGDAGLVYGGLSPIPGQKTIISLEGTTTSIKQELQPDKARGSSISSMRIKLADIDKEATKIATGFYGEDILYKDVKLWLGFGDQISFNDDYILIFRGLIESLSIGQSSVTLNLSSPDQKRRQAIALKGDTELQSAITDVQTSIPLDSVENFLTVPVHPLYPSGDQSLKTYVRIEDEIIQYTGISGNQLTGCTRGALSTVAIAHDAGTQSETFLVLEGNIFDLALKIMLSDKDLTPYIEDLPATSVGIVNGNSIANAIFFINSDFVRDYSVNAGDYITTSGFTEGANNLGSYTEILGVEILDSGSYIIVDSALDLEASATGSVSFLSKYNTLGDFGLGMNTEEIDIEKHIFLKENFLNSADVRIYIRDEIDEAKEFIELELYKIFACYSLPSDKRGLSRLSVGYHVAPLPLEQIITVSKENVINPDNIKSERSINKYHYNAVGFVYNDSPLDDVLRKKIFQVIGTQLVPTGNKILKIEAKGFRDDLGAQTESTRSATRLLDRYKGAAEFYPGVEIEFSSGVLVNIGDIVIMDPTDLNLPNRLNSTRNKEPLLMEVLNKSTSIKDGKTVLSLIDTSFDITSRLGLVSPTSKITKVIDQTQFYLEHPIGSDYSKYGIFEGRKWDNYIGASVEIYNSDFTQSDTAIILSVIDNVMKIDSAPVFTATANTHFIKLSDYSDQPENIKLVFAFASDDTNNFSDGKSPYTVL